MSPKATQEHVGECNSLYIFDALVNNKICFGDGITHSTFRFITASFLQQFLMADKFAGLNVKQFSAILNTVFKSRFEKDKAFTVEALKEQAFAESTETTIEGMMLFSIHICIPRT